MTKVVIILGIRKDFSGNRVDILEIYFVEVLFSSF